MVKSASLKFAGTRRDFVATLNERVIGYFKANNISRQGNYEMVIKTIFMFLLYLVPYFLVLTSTITATPWLLLMAILMGFGSAGIGLSVMHDANHGAYAKKAWVNDLIGYSVNLLGVTAFT
ncbi:MAG TPA: acyl-CoA desaturase, partial [Cyclobacteriaceae bacterium]